MADLVANENIEWVQGDDNVMYLAITDPQTLDVNGDPTPVDLTNGKVWVVAKRNQWDDDASAIVNIDSSGPEVVVDQDPTTGLAVATVPKALLAGLRAPTWLYYAVQANVEQLAGTRTWEVVRGTVYVSKGLLDAVA